MFCRQGKNPKIVLSFLWPVFAPLFILQAQVWAGHFSQTDFLSPLEKIALPDSFYSEKRNFLVHYTTAGDDAVTTTDENQNNIPDRIEKIAAAFEKSYSVEVLELGYSPPPSMRNGEPYQIYVRNLNTYFARTVPLNFDSTKTTNIDLASYILFDNDFSGQNYHIHGDNAIRTIAAHEFFHAIQMGYVFRQIDGFFMELTAVWMEDQVFDDIDNYRYFLNYFFAAPDIPLSGVSYTIPNITKHIYGRAIWAFFIAQRYGKNAIRRIFELMTRKPALDAMNDFFHLKYSSFENEFANFCEWNFFTGERAMQEFGYPEASSFPLVPTRADTIFEYFAHRSGAGYFLTSAYYLFHPRHNGNIKINFNADFPQHWHAKIAIFDNDEILFSQLISAGDILTLTDIALPSSVLVIPCNSDRSADPRTIFFKQKPENYYLSLSLQRETENCQQPAFKIISAEPNPFDSRINFIFSEKIDCPIRVEIFNILGQRIFEQEISYQTESWQWFCSSNFIQNRCGIYFFRFTHGQTAQIIKAVYIP